MADGIKCGVKLNVGFLNHDRENLEQKYLDAFDVVLTNDTSMEFVIRLINAVA